jgi:CPA1 family monovalent cation:H+ antiporter
MSAPALLSVVVAAAALLGLVNHRWVGLPPTIGVTVGALLVSLAVVLADTLGLPVHGFARDLVARLHFRETLLDGMLSFLLFAGALEVDLQALLGETAIVAVLATIGVVVTTAIVGALTVLVAGLLGLPIGGREALLFGAVVAPTDPIAVLGMLRASHAPKRLEVQMAGESLFNDAVGVVVFFALAGIAAGRTVGAAAIAGQFAWQVAGGLALGLAAGWLALRIICAADDEQVALMTTLAVALGLAPLGARLHTSGFLAVIVAGLMLGNAGGKRPLPPRSAERLTAFWELVDEVLNVALFTLVGLQVLVVPFTARVLAAGLLVIPVVLLARLATVAATLAPVRRRLSLPPRSIAILTWGGLRGGLAIALALSIDPAISAAPLLLAMTYVVVVFSIVVQGLTFRRLLPPPP